MPIRLTTPGMITAVLVAVVFGVLVALRVAGPAEPTTLDLPVAPKAGASSELASFNPSLIYEYRNAGVATIESVFADAQVTGGTGFVADAKGHIVTSSHVVVVDGATAKVIYINLPPSGDEQAQRVTATVVGIDPYSDLAVLKVDPDEVRLRPVPLGNSDKIGVGDPVAAIGAPFGQESSLTTGIVSAVKRTVDSQVSSSQIADAIQVDVSINRGNSGGPLFNARGEVVGVNQQILTTSGKNEGVAFAIPINTVKRAMEQIIDTGRVRYAHLGIWSETVTPQLARKYGLKKSYGALVARAEGPASRAGLSAGQRAVVFQGQEVRLGDQIVKLAGQRVTSRDDVKHYANMLDVNERVEVVFYRAGKRHTATLTTGEKQL